MISRAPYSFRLWAGLVLVAALAFCVTGMARPAMAMTGPMQTMHHGAGHTAGQATTSASAEAGGMGDCPSTTTACAQPSVGPTHGTDTGHAGSRVADAGAAVSSVSQAPRSGVPPPTAPTPPPDLHRLCVCRT
ncbi:hypothetical protein Q5762_32650 [Streptomyces sp. P9(2023)]|uniref:hypothetical protein n=1 Tax=Streptomyces sp. P9(2023) TaxID=3064394 RepID=UPI0028F457AF|nr:hypothetical protein [Streptomyces sp. P9(2023)]MDT9692990.1 hypothetical protein [Streptomyces sp. P9(2023)]